MGNIKAQTEADCIKKLNLRTLSDTVVIEVIDITKTELPLSFKPDKIDSITSAVYLPVNNSFKIYSDIDTIAFDLPLDSSVVISIVKDDKFTTIVKLKNGLEVKTLTFDEKSENPDLKFLYEEDENSPYLSELKQKYPIDSIASQGKTDIEKTLKIMAWVHSLWKHDGWNEPEKSDAIFILDEVKKGKRFRCVEYGIVTAACLKSIGLKSRVLSLKTEDVEVRPTGAGHVLLEVFINDLNKWVILDSQFNIIPNSDDVPLNAVELQAAITNNRPIGAWSSDENVDIEIYKNWIYEYLYYFSVNFDNRENINREDKYMHQGKVALMLVPQGAKNPTVFQIKYPINYCFYTNSVQDFYRAP